MDAVDLLVRQHEEMESALSRVLDAQADTRGDLFAQIADELTVHMIAEEAVFYPAVKARRTEDILLESLEEHLSLKRLLADLLALAPGDATFEAKFKVLKEQAEHHHDEEEEHLFPKVRNLLDSGQRAELAREMCDLQQRMREEGRPRARVVGETDAAAPLR
jgi:hemerythrin superfamily protein